MVTHPCAVLSNYAAHPLTVGPGHHFFSADFPGVANALIEKELRTATAFFTNGAVGNIHPRKSMKRGIEMMAEIGRSYGDAVLGALNASEPVDCSLAGETQVLTFPNRMDPLLAVEAELRVLGIGPICIAVVPGEYFVEFQMAFKQALAPRPAFLIGCANGWLGWMSSELIHRPSAVLPYQRERENTF